jgi:hypothetical protein
LRNNQDLRDCLKDFEEAWNIGKEHLMSQTNLKHLVQFSALLVDVSLRYKEFNAMIEDCDTQLFLSIPALVLLYDMESIVLRFAPGLLPKLTEIANEVLKSGRRSKIELDLLEVAPSGT